MHENPGPVPGFFIAWLEIFCASETERRPRGASRINPLLHLLQRTYA